jgi:hypothetical protein
METVKIIQQYLSIISIKVARTGSIYLTTNKGIIRISNHERVYYRHNEPLIADIKLNLKESIVTKILGGLK